MFTQIVETEVVVMGNVALAEVGGGVDINGI